MSELPPVQVYPAFRWECPQCGRENFDRAQDVEFDNESEEEECRAALGDVEDIVAVPDSVTCRDCLGMFRLE